MHVVVRDMRHALAYLGWFCVNPESIYDLNGLAYHF